MSLHITTSPTALIFLDFIQLFFHFSIIAIAICTLIHLLYWVDDVFVLFANF